MIYSSGVYFLLSVEVCFDCNLSSFMGYLFLWCLPSTAFASFKIYVVHLVTPTIPNPGGLFHGDTLCTSLISVWFNYYRLKGERELLFLPVPTPTSVFFFSILRVASALQINLHFSLFSFTPFVFQQNKPSCG